MHAYVPKFAYDFCNFNDQTPHAQSIDHHCVVSASMMLLLYVLATLCCHVYSNSESVVGVDSTSFQSVNENYKYNVRFAPGVHPAVKPLEKHHRASESMNAKFRYVL